MTLTPEQITAANRSKSRDLFCKCCKNFYKRDDVTFLRPGGEDAMYYKLYGMCQRCYNEANPGRDEALQTLAEEYVANNQTTDISPPIGKCATN